MKKRKAGIKLSRGQGARKALYRTLIKALVEHGKITTTKPKASIIKKRIDRLVNLAKKGGLHNRRRVYAMLGNDRKTVDKIFGEIVAAFNKKTGGYVKLTNLPRRRGDNAEMSRVEWVEEIKTSTTGSAGRASSKGKKKTEDKKTKGIRGVAKRIGKKAISTDK